MDLHSIVSSVTSAIKPLVSATYQASTGYTGTTSGDRIPTYAPAVPIVLDVQPLSDKDLRQMNSLNVGGIQRKIYLSGSAYSVVRSSGLGGDLFTFDDHLWLVTQPLEQFDSWGSFAVTQQSNDPAGGESGGGSGTPFYAVVVSPAEYTQPIFDANGLQNAPITFSVKLTPFAGYILGEHVINITFPLFDATSSWGTFGVKVNGVALTVAASSTKFMLSNAPADFVIEFSSQAYADWFANTWSAGVQVVANDGTSDVLSNVFYLNLPELAPYIDVQPVTQAVADGTPVTFTVHATGIPTPIYQWFKNGKAIPGATSATYSIAAAHTTDDGYYSAQASNFISTAKSASASLAVTPPAVGFLLVAGQGVYGTAQGAFTLYDIAGNMVVDFLSSKIYQGFPPDVPPIDGDFNTATVGSAQGMVMDPATKAIYFIDASQSSTSLRKLVFTTPTTGSITTVYNYDYFTELGRPLTGVTLLDSFLYSGEGTDGSGNLWKNPADGSDITGVSFQITGDFFGLSTEGSNVYVAAWSNHNVERVTPTGTVTVLSADATLLQVMALAYDGSGSLYAASSIHDPEGGYTPWYGISKINVSTGATTVFVPYDGTQPAQPGTFQDGITNGGQVISFMDGHLYLTASNAGPMYVNKYSTADGSLAGSILLKPASDPYSNHSPVNILAVPSVT